MQYSELIKHLEIMLEYNAIDMPIIATYLSNGSLIGFSIKEPINFDKSEVNIQKGLLELYLEVRSLININQKYNIIKTLRISKRINTTELSKLIGKTKQEVSRWESGVVPGKDLFDVIISHLN